jgi:hypothetical protein
MSKNKFVLSMLFLFSSLSIQAMDIETQCNQEDEDILNELTIDDDLKEKLLELCNKPKDEIEYYEVIDVLNEQQIRCSKLMGLIVLVSEKRIAPIHYYDDKWLEFFYDKNTEKFRNAKSYWEWHRRTSAIGLPPQWPVNLKKVMYYASCILCAGGIYLLKDQLNIVDL